MTAISKISMKKHESFQKERFLFFFHYQWGGFDPQIPPVRMPLFTIDVFAL